MSVTLIVVMVSWVLAYVQAHHIVHIQHVQFFVYHYTFIKLSKIHFLCVLIM